MAVLALREITEDNRAAVEALGVTEEQSSYVAGVADSLVEAAEHPDAKPWYRAIYADDEPVGFVMISDGITVDNPEYVGPAPTSCGGCSSTIASRAAATAPPPSTSWSSMFALAPMPECC